MEGFEALMETYLPPLRRFFLCRVSNPQDAEDLTQETCLAASRRFERLTDREMFMPWLLAIARRKYADYCRARARSRETLTGDVPDAPVEAEAETDVMETLAGLPQRDRLMLTMFYREHMPQKSIAKALGIPEGTVKSRLFAARDRFRRAYPHPPKGERKQMDKLPKILPPYTITEKKEPPFPVKWEETPGWLIVPKIGEKLRWGMYDLPSRKLDVAYDMQVTGKASVHGQEGVEIIARAFDVQELEENDLMRQPVKESGAEQEIWRFIAQIKDDRTRFLAAEREEDGVKVLNTFLDPEFLDNWGEGENNQGKPVYWAPKGAITREGVQYACAGDGEIMDMVGRFDVTLDGKTYDTVRIMDVNALGEDVVSEQYIDEHGRTVLWRRFNGNHWRSEYYGGPWTELLPDNERITVNGKTYVHWYDCLPER